MGIWLNYIIVIVITGFVVSIITENAVINRLQIGQEGVVIAGGRCRLLDGYGKIGSKNEFFKDENNSSENEKENEKELNYDIIKPMSNNSNNYDIDGWEGW